VANSVWLELITGEGAPRAKNCEGKEDVFHL